jgi:uncharacterized protein (TIGR03437 family)
MRQKTQLTALLAFFLGSVHGQTLDNSGNGMLNGGFRFRQVAALAYDNNGFVTQVRAAYGAITFDGAGNYTITGSYIDNTVSKGAPQTLSVNGTYVIGSNGTGYIANPFAPTTASSRIYGAVAQGVFTGSSTEEINVYLNDLFVAIPVGSPPTNSSFTGSYWAGVLDFTGASDAALKNAMFQLNPNGQGGFGNITVTGQDYSVNSNSITQTVAGGTYSFAGDGTSTLNLPLPSGVSSSSSLFAGTKTMFLSADGNFILGWTATGYDIFVGVRAMTTQAGNSTFQGLYYTGALEDTSYCGIDSYSGSVLSAAGDGNQIVHQRANQPLCELYAYDYVTDNVSQIGSNGTTPNPDLNGYTYAFGAGGQAFVAVGTGGFFSLTLGLHSKNFSGSGVYLTPNGIFNAASYAPVTAGLAPGELITLFGSGFTNSPQSVQGGQPFPMSLGGVQVTINNTPCPIYFVSPAQISVIVPYGVSTAPLVAIQVSNNGALSNTVTLYETDELPGVFTQNQAGYGVAAMLHASNGSVVTASNPAKTGEYISVFLTGLGTVTPAIQDGVLGPSNPLSNADVNRLGELLVYFNDYSASSSQQGTIQYAGLAPGLAGLYQLNVQVPAKVGPGNVYLEIVVANQGDTSQILADVNQVQIPIGSGTASAARPESRAEARTRQTLGVRHGYQSQRPETQSRGNILQKRHTYHD